MPLSRHEVQRQRPVHRYSWAGHHSARHVRAGVSACRAIRVCLDLDGGARPGERRRHCGCALERRARLAYGKREIAIRCNGLNTPWGEADIAAIAGSGADALVVETEWPVYRSVPAGTLAEVMPSGLVIDANGFTRATLGADPRLRVIAGKAVFQVGAWGLHGQRGPYSALHSAWMREATLR